MIRTKSKILDILLIVTLFLMGSCKRNVINPNGEGCRKIKDISGPEYPIVMHPTANWSTGKFAVSVQTGKDEPWQLRAYSADLSSFTVLDEAPIVHVSAWSNGNWIAYYDWDDGGVYRIKPDGSLKRRISSSPMGPRLLWHPEEDILLIRNSEYLWRMDLEGNLVEDTLRLSDPDLILALNFMPMHWHEGDRIYGHGSEFSSLSYYSIREQEVVDVYNFGDNDNPDFWLNYLTSLDDDHLVISNGEGVSLFDLSSQKTIRRLLKKCENQSASRVSAYDTENFFMEVFLVGRDGVHRNRIFRKNINEKSEEELDIF